MSASRFEFSAYDPASKLHKVTVKHKSFSTEIEICEW